MSIAINHTLLAKVARMEQNGGTSAPIVARTLNIPLSTAGVYLARVRGRPLGQKKRWRWVILIADPKRKSDYAIRTFQHKERAQMEVESLNAQFMSGWTGCPWDVPLAYMAHEQVAR